jgi:hypothetical protein
MTNRPAKIIPIRPDLSPWEKQEIAALAFEYWLARGFRDGSPEEDLLRAEWEVARAARRRKSQERMDAPAGARARIVAIGPDNSAA